MGWSIDTMGNQQEAPINDHVIILGGGLAGLTLALQLRQQQSDIRISVIERARHPVPEAIHKVGESTVEIGAHYLAHTLGLRDHLDNQQLRKYGLRLFFDAGQAGDLSEAAELGASHLLTIPGYQVDRGILENHLGQRARELGVELIDGATVHAVALAGDKGDHTVRYRLDNESFSRRARWVVDAMGRGSILKRQLGLAEPNDHNCSAVWFRIDTRVDLGQWSDDQAWARRCSQLPRWLSTNHLMGAGYWVWLIPLSSGSTSFGIVFDTNLHDLTELKSWEGTLAWLSRHQPRCRQAIEQCNGKLQDFHFLRDFSYGCKQVFSADRWALTGEAGVFLDPLYSPGSDFIGISNTFVTDLICRDLAGESFARRARQYERIYMSFYDSSLHLYKNQYPLFGHTRAMSLKTVWDYAYYWGVLSLLFFSERLTDIAFIGRHIGELGELRELHIRMQRMFLAWSRQEPQIEGAGLFVNQSVLPLLTRLNRELTEVMADTDQQLDARLSANAEMLKALGAQLRALAPEAAGQEVDTELSPGNQDLLAGLPAVLRHSADA